jgi:hypothetical protein
MEAETYKEVGMSTVVFDISMSLDGFITASGRRPEEPMGDGGQRLHEWAFGEDERNREFFERSISELGAVIAGRNTYDDSLPWWGTDGPGPPTAVRGHARGARGESRGWRLHLRDRRHRERARAGEGRRRRQDRHGDGRGEHRPTVHRSRAHRRDLH